MPLLSGSESAGYPWRDALIAAQLFAVAPQLLKGIHLKAGVGPVRDLWLSYLRDLAGSVSFKKLPLGASDEQLLGGLDLAQSLTAGRPVLRNGIFQSANRGVLLASMAERMSLDTASRLSNVLDFGEFNLERDGLSQQIHTSFGVVLLDEGEAGEDPPPPSLLDRLPFRVCLDPCSLQDAILDLDVGPEEISKAIPRLKAMKLDEEQREALCVVAARLGVQSLRSLSLAGHVARAHAALQAREAVQEEDIALAAKLVFVPRATQWPQEQESAPEQSTEREENREEQEARHNHTVEALEDVVLDAIETALPAGLLDELKLRVAAKSKAQTNGREGQNKDSATRGRPLAARRGELRSGRRLDVLATLRAAAPWQKIRRQKMQENVQTHQAHLSVRRDDFHLKRFREKSETATVFAVDASGSTAISRLAEAKGAIELLLAESYARRDHVALISFRGGVADLLLAPTRSLVRAKRALSALPGGGGTPLASGLQTSMAVMEDAQHRGRTPTLVLLTDGSANINLEGKAGRAEAFNDALNIAKIIGGSGAKNVVIDISKRKNSRARELADAMHGHYVPLPHLNAQSLSDAVRAVQ